MANSLRIIIADSDGDTRSCLSRALSRKGHQIVACVGDRDALAGQCLLHEPDLVITDICMPTWEVHGAASRMWQKPPVPVILLTAHVDQSLVQRAADKDVIGYLVKPVNELELEVSIALAWARIRECTRHRQEAKDLRQALDDRKVIERAKGILMKRVSLDEQSAFRRLQKLASARNMRLADLARRVCEVEETVDWSEV